MTQVDLDFVLDNTNALINKAVHAALSNAKKVLEEHDCHQSELLDPLIAKSLPSAAPNYFETFKTAYRQQQFFQDHMDLITPFRVALPAHARYFGRVQTDKPQRQKEQSTVNVSLIEQLSLMLNREDIYMQVFGDKEHTDGVLSRYEDGSAFKNNDLFKCHPKSLQIHLYLDEAQVCDALGSKTFFNKEVFVYFTLGNLDLKFRSNLKNIFLLSIFPNHFVKEYSLNVLLRPIVDELKQLEDGVDFIIGGVSRKIYGTLAIFTADNLGAYLAAGFKLGFAIGFRKCRYCLALDEDIQSLFSDCSCIYRTKESHNLHCAGLDTEYGDYFARLYGINFDSILNELKYFHVIGGMVPDVMHDILEGILPKMICLMLKAHIKKKFYTLKMLNHAVRNFNYGHAEVKDKPSQIDVAHINKGKLRQSAAQIWQLAVILPLAVGSRVPEDDAIWLCFLDLLAICRLIFKPTISEAEIVELEFLIFDFLSAFKECFPGVRISPKFHFLVHYPYLIRLLGPLLAYWCMRYEAKHSYFKQLSRSIGNYINLPWTLANRHQLLMCKNFSESPRYYLRFPITLPNKKSFVTISNVLCCIQVSILLNIDVAIHRHAMLTKVPWVSIGSTCFKVNKSFVLCPFNGNVSAVFAKIVSILAHESRIVFVCDVYTAECFDEHLQAFRLVRHRKNLKIAILSDALVDHRIYHLHSPVDLSLQNVVDLSSQYIVCKSDVKKIVLPEFFYQ